jgi:multisubunit Na+/H+ antiporter MnhB subunit
VEALAVNAALLIAFDALLAGLLLWLAWRALSAPDLFEGTVLFIAFGLGMALAWVRLRAPDIALAEAAVGSGITGALLLAAWNRMRPPGAAGESAPLEPASSPAVRRSFAVACAGLAPALGWAVLSLPPDGTGLTARALGALPRSGASNPVTAVLLNYRAYDTLLELAVLLLAVAAAWSMARADEAPRGVPRGPVPRGLARLSAPLLVLLAGYFLWIGSSCPGGAFQAGALLGGAGVLLLLAYGSRRRLPAEWVGRSALALGLAVFSAVAVGVMRRGSLLEYPESAAGGLILLIEAAAAVSIGAALVGLFLGGRPSPGGAVAEEDR